MSPTGPCHYPGYSPVPFSLLEEIRADLLVLEREAEGLLVEIVRVAKQ